MIVHQSDCQPCAYCKGREEAVKRRRLKLHKARKDHFLAKKNAIMSGKLAVITQRDEVTGFFYRYDKNTGNLITLGRGTNYGA